MEVTSNLSQKGHKKNIPKRSQTHGIARFSYVFRRKVNFEPRLKVQCQKPDSQCLGTSIAEPVHSWGTTTTGKNTIQDSFFLACSFKKKKDALSPQKRKIIKKVDTNHKKNKSLVPTFFGSQLIFVLMFASFKKISPRIWTNVATPLVSEVHTLRIKFLHPSPPIFEGNFCHQDKGLCRSVRDEPTHEKIPTLALNSTLSQFDYG